MEQLSVKEYKVNIYYDIEEWGREFYGMPEGSILEDREELESECMGFACPDDNRISIFIPKIQKYRELEKTVAHELGHLMEFKAESSDEAEKQEEKANHYESFYELVDEVIIALDGLCKIHKFIMENQELLNAIGALSVSIDSLLKAGDRQAVSVVVKKLLELITKLK